MSKHAKYKEKKMKKATSISEDDRLIRKRAKAAERVRRYRARQAAKARLETAAKVSTVIHTSPLTSIATQTAERLLDFRVPKPAKRVPTTDEKRAANAERVRRFRARKPAKKAPLTDKQRAANAERVRKFRARKAAEKAAETARNGIQKDSEAKTDLSMVTYKDYWSPCIVGTPTEIGCKRPATEPLEIPCLVKHRGAESTRVKRQQESCILYPDYNKNIAAHIQFKKNFLDNDLGACCVCDRLWYKSDLKPPPPSSKDILAAEFPKLSFASARVCCTCGTSLKNDKIPALSKSNGFVFPPRPGHLPVLDLITERLISPRLSFVQIRRLRHAQDQDGVFGQVINIPVSVNTMVTSLPRELYDDYCVNVHIKRKKIHKPSCLIDPARKEVVKSWLDYLVETPMYKLYDVKVNESFFEGDDKPMDSVLDEDISESIEIEESLMARQHTLLWNEDKHLCTVNNASTSLFDEHCEELSFPSIYLGQFRKFKEGVTVTPSMMTTSELRRTDRRAVTPAHLLFMAMKTMRLRARDSLTTAFKLIGKNKNITKVQVESTEFINGCIDTNLAFLRAIPNSAYYWSQRKSDLFAMIRQLGKPTFFLTMSANEIGWPKLMRFLYKLKYDGAYISAEDLKSMHCNLKASLVNEDPVTCAIHFNKLVNCVVSIIQSKRWSPFGNNYVTHYFKRIEFQQRGSPHAHILLWINDAPSDPLGDGRILTEALIDKLVSVNEADSSGYLKLQTHKHTFACNKNNTKSETINCRFGAPFMPNRSTMILLPMPNRDSRRKVYSAIYNRMWKALEEKDYTDMDAFLKEHKVHSDELYLNILRAGISIPTVFLKRQPAQKWINPFNPFILNVLGSSTDLQFITEEYSCATYVVEYVNKSNRGISDLQQNIKRILDECPELDIVETTRKLSVDMLNCVELTSQEAAWYLLRQPTSECSDPVIYIPTSPLSERERARKTNKQTEAEDDSDESSDNWKDSCFDIYQKRPEELEDITLAQAVAHYMITNNGWKRRRYPMIIRYRGYDISTDPNEYKREMVTMHLPFRDEEAEILAHKRFLQLYDDNDTVIMQRREEFESTLDIAKTLDICRELCAEEEGADYENDVAHFAAHI